MREERAGAGAQAGEAGCRRTILVAEPSATVRSLLRAVLQEEGFLVLEADRVRELLSIVAGMEAPLDLVIAGERLLSAGREATRPGWRPFGRAFAWCASGTGDEARTAARRSGARSDARSSWPP